MSISSERGSLIFQKTERALRNLSSSQQAENVHSFRTATRRLQTLLEQLLPKRDRNQKKVLKSLERIRKRAGKVRDVDVQLAALRSLKIPQEPRRKTQLMQGLIEIRSRHERRLRKLLTKDAVRDVRKRLARTAKEVGLEVSRDPLSVAREILAGVERPAGPATEEVLHQYRIVVKRARYAAEFAPKSAEATQFINQLKHLQDAVGNWHDWFTLTQSAAKRLGDINQSSLVAALHNVTAVKFRHAVAAVSAPPAVQVSAKALPAIPEPARKMRTQGPTLVGRTESAA